MRQVNAFLDTNIFLHYQELKSINWFELFPDAESIQLLIALSVLNELAEKEHGSSPKLRDRANRALKEIKASLGSNLEGSINKLNIRIELINIPSEETLTNNHLNTKLGDDLLLGSIIEFNEKTDCKAILICGDSALLQRVKFHKIDGKEMLDKYKLPYEIDNKEKQIKLLEEEIKVLKDKLPKLQLKFKGNCRIKEFHLINPGPIISFCRELLEKRESSDPNKTRSEIESARKKCSIELAFELINSGSAPASDINIELSSDLITKNLKISPSPNQTKYFVKTFMEKGLWIKDKDTFMVEYKLSRLLQSKSFELMPIYISFENWLQTSDINDFIINYKIIAAEIPTPEEGTLIVLLKKDDNPFSNP